MSFSGKQVKVAEELAQGDKTIEQIANEYDINPRTIYRWKKDTDFINLIDEYCNEIRENVKRKLISLSPKAFKKLEKLLDARSEMVTLLAVKDVLDRAEIKPPEKGVEINNNNTVNTMINTVDDDELEKMLADDDDE